jgi:diadenosine tetraphosphatase ApaH/serine/threonine PP2A family protein phosphatase
VAPGCRPEFEWLADATYPIGFAQLSGDERRYLADLPRRLEIERDGIRYGLVHATPKDPLYAYVGIDPEGWAEQMEAVDVDVLLVGHTHLQFELNAGGTRVINPGSVGQPKDGDPRAAYAVLDRGTIRRARAPYPIKRSIEALAAAGVAPPVVEQLADLLLTGVASVRHPVPPPL